MAVTVRLSSFFDFFARWWNAGCASAGDADDEVLDIA